MIDEPGTVQALKLCRHVLSAPDLLRKLAVKRTAVRLINAIDLAAFDS